jgi:hypothetical protein
LIITKDKEAMGVGEEIRNSVGGDCSGNTMYSCIKMEK